MSFPNWLKRMIAAFIGGAFNAMAVVVIDPFAFNFSGQWRKTLGVAVAGGILAVSGFLRQFPGPDSAPTINQPTENKS